MDMVENLTPAKINEITSIIFPKINIIIEEKIINIIKNMILKILIQIHVF